MKRPASLAEVATQAQTPDQLGYAIVEFLDHFYLENDWATLREEPRLLRAQLHDDGLADAYLAAVAVHLSQKINAAPPLWAHGEMRYLHRPWFARNGEALRATLLLESPAAFRERNLFISRNALERA